jgi:hypothetical protein
MSSQAKDSTAVPSLLQRLWPWLIELWIAYVLVTFFVVRIIGSGMVQRFLTLVRLRLAR